MEQPGMTFSWRQCCYVLILQKTKYMKTIAIYLFCIVTLFMMVPKAFSQNIPNTPFGTEILLRHAESPDNGNDKKHQPNRAPSVDSFVPRAFYNKETMYFSVMVPSLRPVAVSVIVKNGESVEISGHGWVSENQPFALSISYLPSYDYELEIVVNGITYVGDLAL